ncbi:MAG: bacteriorhodopsin [Bacteroidota bacterium]
MIPNLTYENFFSISPMAYHMTGHILTLGYAVMFAGLLYFALTIKTVLPKYRISSVLSAVVMVSAALLLYKQAQSWESSFLWNGETGMFDPVALAGGAMAAGPDVFSNGFRYLNWLIDVPMLLFQILFVVSLTTSTFSSIRNQFWFSGTGMIVTGYIGQFYEVSSPTMLLIWGTISTLFFFHVLYLMKKVINEGKVGIPAKSQKLMDQIWLLFFVSWMLYPGAYLLPVVTGGHEGSMMALLGPDASVVGRQMTYTVADVSSKVIYGILLTMVAQDLSENEGYTYNKMTEVA